MPCEILTEGTLQAALRRELRAEQRAVLLRHLREPCKGCLDLLEGWTAEEMMLSPDDSLSLEERASLFAAVAPPARPALKAAHRQRWRLPRVVFGASAAALAVGLVLLLRPTQRRSEGGLKGAAAAPVTTLIPLIGARTPIPHVVRALEPGGRVAPGESLLLRIRLNAPAWVYLLSQKQGEAAELIWPRQPAPRHEAGEFELAESGSALAIDPSAFGIGGRLLLIASQQPIDRRQLEIRQPLATREDLERTFAGCGVDLLPIVVEPP